jgi:nucleoside-diphosphate-sugar epimerase
MRKILVTGGAGFLGSYLVPRLRHNHEVLSIDRTELDVLDVAATEELIERERPDVVCHLAALCGAAPSRERPPEYYAVNALGTVNLLEACRRAGVGRFLFASSLTVFGSSPNGPIHEDSAFAPRHPYAASKVAAEFAVRDYSLHFGVRSIILRPTLVVGEGSKELHAVGDFVQKALLGEEIVLFGGGEHARDFVHPEDVATAMVLAVERLFQTAESTWESFNISNGDALSMKQLAERVIRLVGSGRLRLGPPSNQSFSLYTTTDRAQHDLGFEAHIGIDAMIQRLIHHFKERLDHDQPTNDHCDHHHQCASVA